MQRATSGGERLTVFVRHSIAEHSASSGRDEDRALTSEGVALATNVGELLKIIGLSSPVVASSPYQRARETAERLSGRLQVPFEERSELSPVGDLLHGVRVLLSEHSSNTTIIVVTHQPQFGDCLEYLLGEPMPAPLTPCTAVGVSFPSFRQGAGTLRFMFSDLMNR